MVEGGMTGWGAKDRFSSGSDFWDLVGGDSFTSSSAVILDGWVWIGWVPVLLVELLVVVVPRIHSAPRDMCCKKKRP